MMGQCCVNNKKDKIATTACSVGGTGAEEESLPKNFYVGYHSYEE
jgi:hypothetical protein